MSVVEKRYAKPWVLGLVEAALGIFGIVALVVGPAYWVNGLTQAGANIRVPVAVAPADGEPQPQTIPLDLPAGMQVVADGQDPLPELTAENADLELRAWGRAPWSEWALARGGALLQWLAAGTAALLLRRVVVRIGDAQPFAPGNARRLALVAMTVAVGAYAAPALPAEAAARVLARLGLDGPGASLVVSTRPLDLAPLLVVGLLLALAEAFRQGERLARDTEGLV